MSVTLTDEERDLCTLLLRRLRLVARECAPIDRVIAALTREEPQRAACPNCCCDGEDGIHVDACCDVLTARGAEIAELKERLNSPDPALSRGTPVSPINEPMNGGRPRKNCQTGSARICARTDGVLCPDDSCDIDDGIYPKPAPAPCQHRDALDSMYRFYGVIAQDLTDEVQDLLGKARAALAQPCQPAQGNPGEVSADDAMAHQLLGTARGWLGALCDRSPTADDAWALANAVRVIVDPDWDKLVTTDWPHDQPEQGEPDAHCEETLDPADFGIGACLGGHVGCPQEVPTSSTDCTCGFDEYERAGGGA